MSVDSARHFAPPSPVGTVVAVEDTTKIASVSTTDSHAVEPTQTTTSAVEAEHSEAAALPTAKTPSAAPSPRISPVDVEDAKMKAEEVESGYASAVSEYASTEGSTTESTPASSVASLPAKVHLTKEHIDHLNEQLEHLSPQEILRFAKILFPNLYQSTAFGLTGLATIDMLDKINGELPPAARRPVDLIFLDTLYHFSETLDLVDRVRARYPGVKVHVYRPYGARTTAEFESLYGEKLYEVAPEMYDYTAKVEPLDRAYDELHVTAVLTGRRRSQGGARGQIPVLELDEERGVVKVNPMANWSFQQVRQYIDDNNVPYNALLDRGYKSIGDWHSTSPVGEGEDERAGRWKGQQKTECGIHNKKSRYAQYLAKMDQQAKEEQMEAVSVQLQQQQTPVQVAEICI